MGAGRKTSTYDVDTSVAPSFEEARRNLGESGKLGGVIFGCTHETMDECLRGRIFGLPKSHWIYVYYIEPGLPIFLFNYHDRNMHGIFRATTYGQLEINPHAWTKSEHLKTRYPAQVEVEVWKECKPIHEKQFRTILAQCYYSQGDRDNYFVFELTKNEAKGLISKFETNSINAPQRSAPAPQRLPAPSQAAAAPQRTPSSPVQQPRSAWPAASASAAPAPAAKQPAPLTDGWNTVAKKGKAKLQAAPANGSSSASSGAPAAFNLPEPAAQQPRASSLASAAAAMAAAQAALAPVRKPSPAAAPAAAAPAAAPPQAVRLAQAANGSQQLQATSSLGSNGSGAPGDGRALTPATAGSNLARLRAERAALQQRAAAATGAEAAVLAMQALKMENEELRLGQTILASEVMALRRDLSALAARAQVQLPAVSSAVAQLAGAPPSSTGNASAPAPAARAQSSGPTQHLYLIGGNNSRDWLDTVDIFTPRMGKWRKGTPMLEPRGYGAAAALPGSVLFMGGGNGSTWMNSVLRYDLNTGTWSQAPEMSTVRGSLAAAVLDGKVYAIGGGQPSISLETTEIYDPTHNTFMAGKSMSHKRFTTAAAELGGCIYVAGGYDNQRYLASVERFDPREGRWCEVPPMAHKRGAHTCTAANGCVVAIGGWDGANFLSTVEAYDPRADAWRELTPLAAPRAYCASATVSGRIVVAGGMDGGKHAETVQRFDWDASSWTSLTLPEAVAGKRSFLAACVVEHP